MMHLEIKGGKARAKRDRCYAITAEEKITHGECVLVPQIALRQDPNALAAADSVTARRIVFPQEEVSMYHRKKARIPKEASTEAQKEAAIPLGVNHKTFMEGKVRECRHWMSGVTVKEEDMHKWLTRKPHNHHG